MSGPESLIKGNPWPASSVATAYAFRVAAALIGCDPSFGIAAHSRGHHELLRVIHLETNGSIGFDSYLGLTDTLGNQIVGWEWILDQEPSDVAAEIMTHWLESAVFRARGFGSESRGAAATALRALALIAAMNDQEGPATPYLSIEGAASYNARGGTPDVDVMLLDQLNDYEDAGPRIAESLWLVWSDKTFIAGIDVNGRLVTTRDGHPVVGDVAPGRAGAVKAVSKILEAEFELRDASHASQMFEKPSVSVVIRRSLEVSADDIRKAIVREGHLWGLQRDDIALGFDFGDAAVGGEVVSPEGRVGRITAIEARHLAWTWDRRGDPAGDGPVQLWLQEESACETAIKVTARVNVTDADDVRFFWEQWLDALEDWLTFPTRPVDRGNTARPSTQALWSSHSPRLSELEAVNALREREHDPVRNLLEDVALRALLARALTAQGKMDDAEKVVDEAFSGFSEAPPWVPMLEALERGRIDKARAARASQVDELLDVDDLWTDAAEHLAQCIRIAPGWDVGLVLEAAWELATMTTTAYGPGATSLWVEFGRAVAARATPELRDAWVERFGEL